MRYLARSEVICNHTHNAWMKTSPSFFESKSKLKSALDFACSYVAKFFRNPLIIIVFTANQKLLIGSN